MGGGGTAGKGRSRFNPDDLGSKITEGRDTRDQLSQFNAEDNPSGFVRSRDAAARLRQMERDNQMMLHVGRDDPNLRKIITSPENIMNQQFGTDVKKLAESTSKLADFDIVKSLRVVGVVKE